MTALRVWDSAHLAAGGLRCGHRRSSVALEGMATDLSAPRTILVVDDEAAVRRALTQALERAGYTVMATDNGRHALQLLQDHAIDLVIHDHHMPELSGIDLLKLVRVRHPHVVRITITADKDPDTAVRAINEREYYR